MEQLELLQSENQKLKEENQMLKTQLRKNQEAFRLKDNHIYNLENKIEQQNRILHLLCVIKKIPGFRLLIKGVRVFAQGVKHMPGRLFPKGSQRWHIANLFLYTVRHPIRSYKLYFKIKYKNFSRGDRILDILYLKHGLLEFQKQEQPEVSIVISVYDQIEDMHSCLRFIRENTDNLSYEIILVHDTSTNEMSNLSLYVKGINIVKNKENSGFLCNCNCAAETATGKYILFLDYDTQVMKGWLSSLVELIELDNRMGLVGSKLIDSNQMLQMAGGMLWQDGTRYEYGKGDSAEKPQYNYVRAVDYVSHVSFMMPLSLWKEVEGFDEYYHSPEYGELDLAFKVRKAGYLVMYQPKSVVIHTGEILQETGAKSGFKIENCLMEEIEGFKKKWWREMEILPEPGLNLKNILCRDRLYGRKVILAIDRHVPEIDRDAGSRSTFQYLKLFVKKGYLVKFLGDDFHNREPYTSILEQMGIEVLYGAEYHETILDWIFENRDNIDQAYINRPHIALRYMDFIKENTNIKVIYYGHDLHFLREGREYELTGDITRKEEAEYWKYAELEIMRKADVSYYPSYVEEETIHGIDRSIAVKAVPLYVYDNFSKDILLDFEKRKGLLFVGGFAHSPNVDAVLWFLQEIYPLIRKTMEIPFYIVGSHAPEEVKKLAGNGVVVKGFVNDEELSELYRECRMVVVPLRYGAGVKGKIIDAIYYGMPVITTHIGAEGIQHAENILTVEDEADKFAEKTVFLYQNIERLKQISEETQVFIRKYYGMDAAWEIVKADFT